MSISDDEESFIILGNSPMPSMESTHNVEPQSVKDNEFSIMGQSQIPNDQAMENKENQNSLNLIGGENNKKSLTTSQQSNSSGQMINSVIRKSSGVNSLNSMSSSGGGAGGDNNLAASFLMGEIGADVLKTSVYSQFPSLCSMEACADDLVKLQTLMAEYIDLKNTLSKVNGTMKQFYTKTTQWKEDMARTEQQYQQQLQECQTQIASLRNENIELKRQMEINIAHVRITEAERLKEHQELIQGISEKTAQIEAMHLQIDRLEQHQLASFEYLPKNENDSKEKPDYVARPEHERVVKDFERQMSVLLAENLDLKDVQKQYIDEVNCLKVNCTAGEELIRQLRVDVSMLQAKDMEKTAAFMQYESERDKMREEMDLLHQQVEVYSKDFVIERDARQNLAGEKDQLLQDLRSLQRKNQELIEQQQKRLQSIESQKNGRSPSIASMTTSAEAQAVARTPVAAERSSRSPSMPRAEIFSCPLCNRTFKTLTEVNSHANICLDQNGS